MSPSYPASALHELGIGLLGATGVTEADAALTMRVLLIAERWGLPSHGLLRLPRYLDRLRAGGVNPAARLRTVRGHGVITVLDGEAGLGQPQVWRAAELAAEQAVAHGLSLVALGNTSHAGCLGAYVLPGLARGLVTLLVGNGPAAMAPWGGTHPLFSTSPIAAGVPAGDGGAIVDLSLAAVSRGRVAAAERMGEVLPDGLAFDARGAPTTDPAAALRGTIAPVGGVKGAVLAFLVEALAGGCVGPALSSEVADIFDPEEDGRAQGISHLIVALDPAAVDFDGQGDERRRRLLSAIAAAGGRTPGAARLQALREDDPLVTVASGTVTRLLERAVALGLPVPEVLRPT